MQNYNAKLKSKKAFDFLLVLLTFTFCILHLNQASAATMSDDNYSIEQQDVQIQSFVKERTQPQEQAEQPPLAQGENYVVETTSPETFSFTVANQNISFGVLQATNPVLRKLGLTIQSSRGYQILTAQDHPLRKQDGMTIPDTTCDNGSCSTVTDALWTNALTYGFGYRLDSMQPAYFKHFPDSLKNESIASLLTGAQALNRDLNVTYKVNISATQELGSYNNIVTYIATPDF